MEPNQCAETGPVFSVPESWTIYGEPCPCCGGDGGYEETYDETGDEDGWWYHERVVDHCSWAPGDDGPCPRWPHSHNDGYPATGPSSGDRQT